MSPGTQNGKDGEGGEADLFADLASRADRLTGRRMTRRDILRMGGLLAGVAAVQPLLSACGSGSSSSSPTAAATSAALPPTVAVPVATVGAGGGSPVAGAAAINVKAHEAGDAMVYDIDQLAVPAGPVQINFTNTGKKIHEVWLYPLQDLVALLALKRQGKDVDETQYIKGLAGKATDIDPGKSATVNATLTPGFYELACFVEAKNPDGSTSVHFDMGMVNTIAVTGPGGPDASVTTPSDTVSLDMAPGTGDLSSSWLFLPDHLVVKAGSVNFKVKNDMPNMKHDVVIYPQTDITPLIHQRLADKEDYSIIKGQLLVEDLDSSQSIEKAGNVTPGWWYAACFRVSTLPDGTKYVHSDRGQRFSFLAQ